MTVGLTRYAAKKETDELKEKISGLAATATAEAYDEIVRICDDAYTRKVNRGYFSATLDRNEAAIAVVDSNLHRERLLPSEKAFAYKMKMEALKAQGKRNDLTLSQVATKSDAAAEIGKAINESRDQVFRYIRLTNLIPEILSLVDEGRIALTPAVELSYLTEPEQSYLMEIIESEDCTPSLSQAVRLKKLSKDKTLNADKIYAIMSEEKANQKERISFPLEDIRRFFPKSYTQKDVYNAILKLVGDDYMRRERSRKQREER